MLRMLLALILALATGLPAAAQSTAINGTIEGTVVDEQNAVLPGVTVTVTNLDTGDTRAVVTNESGLYRAPLLQLGRYRVEAELQGFKKFEQSGVTLSAGQTAVINFQLTVGTLQETVTVTAACRLQAGKLPASPSTATMPADCTASGRLRITPLAAAERVSTGTKWMIAPNTSGMAPTAKAM